ncbi:DNA mismatch repair protein MutS [Desmospora profundinema]|uniref:DNA mismatch repair protein MutS n=1 Tax=Desmospora profundinema TaxID=1571184 RepID=A0ABU1IHN2_9BACL|nr:DNA mismatch repair protein MutS [Desmospora profundinema]MDR6224278.1 DNA mismatch repair protein MutS [Desmospora profundinema]
MAKYTPMIQQYLSIKAEVPDAFLFFRLGDFYEMFFEDAERAAKELEITLTSREGGEERIPMCGVPFHSAEVYIARLIEKGHKVAICEQVEDPATAKGVVKREVVRVVTPGTVMEEKMLTERENNFLAAFIRRQDYWALAAADLSTGEFYVTESSGGSDTVIDELAAFQPKEVLVREGEEHPSPHGLRQRLGTLVTSVPGGDILGRERLSQALSDQFPGHEKVWSSPYILEAAGLLLIYLRQTQKRFLTHLNRIERYDARQYMVLDPAARQTLELTASLKDGKRKGSLLWLLDRTATAMGSRLLKKWMDKPLLDPAEIGKRQDAVAALLENPILLEEVRDRLKEVYDLERLSARIAYGSANGRDLQALRRSLEALPSLQSLLTDADHSLARLAKEMDLCNDVKELVERSVAEDPPVSVKEGNLMKEGFDEELDSLRRIQREGRQWIARLQQQEREATGIKSLKVGFNKVFGYYIEVTKANLRHLPEGRYQRKQTLTNAERFVTAELKEKERAILQAEERSMELEYQLFTRVREMIAVEIPRIQRLADQVARLDVLHAFAVISERHHYIRPSVGEQPGLFIEGGRHPVVEAAMDEGGFVANDTAIGRDHGQILLITGPNMAGKSTYMRQVALITLLAQIGCFVPASRAEIGIVDRIFTRIGAADDLVGGRSTFMVEMDETRLALTQATPRSLILLDEVGRGTSTYDGMALAQAIVEYLHERVGAQTLFSTHYHELTRLAEEYPGVVNLHARCVEKDGEVAFLHRMEAGGADKSYGIHVAQLAGMPIGVIQRARVILESLEARSQTAAAQQLDLFQYTAPPEAGGLTPEEEEVLCRLKEWDLLNRTPMESVQLLHELKRTLQSKATTGGE